MLTNVCAKRAKDLTHSSTLGLMGPTCLELAIVEMLTWLSSNKACISSVPPRINTSLESRCGKTTNSDDFHESSTCLKLQRKGVYWNCLV